MIDYICHDCQQPVEKRSSNFFNYHICKTPEQRETESSFFYDDLGRVTHIKAERVWIGIDWAAVTKKCEVHWFRLVNFDTENLIASYLCKCGEKKTEKAFLIG